MLMTTARMETLEASNAWIQQNHAGDAEGWWVLTVDLQPGLCLATSKAKGHMMPLKSHAAWINIWCSVGHV